MYVELKQALLHFKVIFMWGQPLSNHQFLKLGNSFGTLENHEFFPTVDTFPEIQVIATVGGNTGTDRWHTDVTFRPAPSFASILRACDIPPNGAGDTMWLCTNAAYKGLADPFREMMLKLEALHDIRLGMSGYIDPEIIEQKVRDNPPTLHPAVIKHPFTGKPHLFVNSIWTRHFENMSKDESDSLLKLALEVVKKPEYQVRFRWEKNSIAIWDNLATQHYAVSDYHYPRVMNRMTVDGVKPEPYLT